MTIWNTTNKITTVFTNTLRNISTFIGKTFLLREEGGHILLEGGGRIILTDLGNSNRQVTNYTTQNKF